MSNTLSCFIHIWEQKQKEKIETERRESKGIDSYSVSELRKTSVLDFFFFFLGYVTFDASILKRPGGWYKFAGHLHVI